MLICDVLFAGTSKFFEVNSLDKPEGWEVEEKKG